MTDFVPEGLHFLGLGLGATEREIKRAYATRLKLINAEAESARFIELRNAYEQALAWAGWRLQINAGVEPVLAADPASVVEPDTGPDIQDARSKESQKTVSVNIKGKPSSRSSDASEEQQDVKNFPYPLDTILQVAFAVLENEDPPTPFLMAKLELYPVDSVASAFEEFRTSMAFATSDFPAAVRSLNGILGRANLLMMVDRERFEQLLARAISERTFGARTAVVFLASAQIFSWEDADTSRLDQIGVAGRRLWQLLTELVLLGPATRQRWLLLTEEPNPKTALQLIKANERPESISPVLASLFFPDGHIKAWNFARTKAPLLSRFRVAAPAAFNKNSVALRGLFFLLLVISSLVIMYQVLSNVQLKEGRQAQVSCDQAYGHAITANWKGLSIAQTEVLNSCASTIPPLLCADRDLLIGAVAHAERLLNQDHLFTSSFFREKNIRIDLPDGMRFTVDKTMDCAGLWTFAQRGNWLGEGDEGAARQLIAQLSICPVARNESPALKELLSKTDAWPDTTSPRTRISVGQLVKEAQRPPLVQASAAARLWPVCEAIFNGNLQTKMGLDEYIAVSARANASNFGRRLTY